MEPIRKKNIPGLKLSKDLPFSPEELGKYGLKRRDSSGQNFIDKLDEMAKSANVDSGSDEHLKFDALEMDIDGAAESIAGTEVERLLGEAMELIKQEEFERALELLERAIEASPEHPWATYLSALCFLRLEKPLAACERLRPLVTAAPQEMHTGVLVLRAEIRRAMIAEALREIADLAAAEEAVRRIRPYVEADPGFSLLRSLLAGSMMHAEQYEDALAEAEAGIALGDDNQGTLSDLKSEILERLALARMEAARRCYREGKYRRARTRLLSMDPVTRTTRLCQVFGSYLKRLEGKKLLGLVRSQKIPEEVRPRGTQQELHRFHEFLVEEELQTIDQTIRKEDWAGAESTLDRALALAPHFAWLHYLKAGVKYRRTMEKLDRAQSVPVDEVTSDLQAAHAHACRATEDPDLSAAPDLEQVIETNLAQWLGVVAVNQIISEFNAIDSAAEAMSSLEDAHAVEERLRALSHRVDRARDDVADQEGIAHLDDVEKAIQESLSAMQSQREEAETVAEAFEEIDSILSSVKDGVRPEELDDVESQLRRLKKRIPVLLREVSSNAGRAHLNKVNKALDKHLTDLRNARRNSVVNDLIGRFNALASGPKRYDQAKLLAELAQIYTDCGTAMDSVTDPSARQRLEELKTAIQNIMTH